MRLLSIDIETAPASVWTFSLYRPIIGIEQIISPPRIICFSYQWEGQKKVGFSSEFHDGREAMLKLLHELLEEADAILTYNGKKFDQPWITGELITAGFPPPSPFKHIDLYQVVKSKMRLISNKLDYVSLTLLGDRKVSHSGFTLWKGCLEGDAKSWAIMKKYSIQDTRLMLPLYEKLKGWITGHPNRALIDGKMDGCVNCGSQSMQRRGYAVTAAGRYHRYCCTECGRWMRGKSLVSTSEFRPTV